MARRTASRTASSRSSGPNRSGERAMSSQNLAYQPGKAQLPITVAGRSGRFVMVPVYPRRGAPAMSGAGRYANPHWRRLVFPPNGALMLDVASLRSQFPALHRLVHGRAPIYLDGPGGTQVPRRVIDAMVHYLTTCNANHGGTFAT